MTVLSYKLSQDFHMILKEKIKEKKPTFQCYLELKRHSYKAAVHTY